MVTMRTAGVAEVKASLSEILARVKAGEEVLVTEHGRPIARIVPLSPVAPEVGMEELIRAGVVKAPEGELGEDFWSLERPVDPKGGLLAALLAEREAGY